MRLCLLHLRHTPKNPEQSTRRLESRRADACFTAKKRPLPDRFDLRPPALSASTAAALERLGFRHSRLVFYGSPTRSDRLPEGLSLRLPGPGEFRRWFEAREKRNSWYIPQDYRQFEPLKLRFIKVYRPYWSITGCWSTTRV